MMKQTFIVLALFGIAFSAPQPRKLFSEHVGDFFELIGQESGDEIELLWQQYTEYDEFLDTIKYLETANFKELMYEMESLPEFKAMIDYLENDNIDIHFFVDMLNDILESVNKKKRNSRVSTSGTSLTAFIHDAIALFPKEKLTALFEEKMATDEEFSTALINLQSEEWQQIYFALWENESFQKEVETMRANGVEIFDYLDTIMAIFGLDPPEN